MTVSRNRFVRTLLGSACVMVLAAGAVLAEPRPLTPEVQPLPPPPGSTEAPEDAPFPGTEGAPAPAPGAPDFPPASQPAPAIDEADSFAPMSDGTLDDANGGLGYDLWADTPYESVAVILPRLPVGTVSPTVNDLSRRLLLTIAEPPYPDPRRPGSETQRPFNAIKLERLAKGGLLSDVDALIARMETSSFRTKQLRVDALMLLGRFDEACGEASADRLATNDPYWIELRGLCYAREGNMPAVSLTLEVMRTLGIVDEPYMAIAAHIAEAAPLKLTSLEDPTPIHLALLAIAQAPAPRDGVPDADPGILMAIARSEATPIDVRLLAAEGAAYAGALPVDEFAALLLMLPTKPAELSNLPVAGGDVLVAARHFQNVNGKEGLADRARALEAALSQARSRGLYELYARAFGPLIWDLTPSMETAFFAREAARALVLSGRYDRLADWMNVMAQTSDGATADALAIWLALASPTTERVAAANGPLSRLADAARNAPPDGPMAMRAALTIGLYDALGYQMPENVRMVLVNNPVLRGAPADSATMAGLTDAVRAGRRGDAILHALSIIGAQGPQQANPRGVIEAVAALSNIGLEDEARAIALEALLARPDAAGG